MIVVYNILRYFIYGIIFVVSVFNRKLRIFFSKRLKQDFNNRKFLNNQNEVILIHISSVGEFNLSKELIDRLISKGENIILSIMTDTGKAAAEKSYGNNENIVIFYFPLDDYVCLINLFKRYKIKKTIIIETEIWPNLYSVASEKSKLYIINGRLTEKKMKSYLKIKGFIKKILDKSEKIMVQSDEDRKRYISLGLPEEKIKVYKNLKYSIKYEKISEEAKEKYIKNNIQKEKKIIVCGSTRPGEEKIWLEVFKEINEDRQYQMILVPRHLERINEVISEIQQIFPESMEKTGLEDFSPETKNSKISYSLLSEDRRTDILVVDKMGVLRDFYQIADFVFVGGTLVDIGGHSILEPLYYGKKPIIGNYYQNITEIVEDAKEMDFVKIVENKNEIIEYLRKSEIVDTSEFFRKNNEIDKILEELE